MKALAVLLLAASLSSCARGAAPMLLKDKTLVVWAAPANLTQSGGSALLIDDRKSHFDGVVYGEPCSL